VKVAICIPCHGDTKADFTFCLARMIAATVKSSPDIEVETLISRSSILVQSRTNLFNWSREWGADSLLWVDSDQTFPPDALLKLRADDLPFVGANCRRKHPKVFPSAVKRDGKGNWHLVHTTAAKAATGEIEEVDRLGFGFTLMQMEPVLAALGTDIYPLFETRSLDDGKFIGEDALFCDRLRAAGLKIHVDHAVSMLVGHIAEQTLMFPPG
jgi:hypothetical protein